MQLKTAKFLVVDDDELVRQTIVDFLSSAGCASIAECDNGIQAMELIRKGGVEFVISDWDMPGMDGLELLKQVRADEKYKDLPFVMSTAPIHNEQLKVVDAATGGVDAYLIKPYRARTLIQKIKDVIYEHNEEMKKDVVLVDDDDDVREFLLAALKELGYNPVSGFSNGNDAYDYVEKNHDSIALVISDWEMPKMTGIELLHKIRINKKIESLPFIIVTSPGSIEKLRLKQAIDADVDSYLMKPFRVEILETKIKMVLAKAKVEGLIVRGLESGGIALGDHDLEDAERSFKRVLALDPKNVLALLGLANVERSHASPKAMSKAVGYIQKAIEISPRYDRAYIELALAYEESRSLDSSIGILKEALLNCFPLDRIHFHLGRLLLSRGKQEEAIPNLEKAIELNPKLVEAEALLIVAKEGPKKKK